VANNVGPGIQSIPEAPITDFAMAGSGYGESKLVAEHLLLEASAHSAVDVTICRVGQIAGPIKKEHRGGQWNRKEWFPCVSQFPNAFFCKSNIVIGLTRWAQIMDASVYLSKLPDSLGRNEWVDWIPVDQLSGIVLELSGIHSGADSPKHISPRIVHAVNPQRCRWRSLLPAIQITLSKQSKTGGMQVVSLQDWVEALNSASVGTSKDEVSKMSAFKLLKFLSSLTGGDIRPEFETVETVRCSQGLRSLKPIEASAVKVWLSQWGYPVEQDGL
jgi:hypothetical protein